MMSQVRLEKCERKYNIHVKQSEAGKVLKKCKIKAAKLII